eukprot:scaffold11000_cov108-Isochrysis_galbana.AAC.1
METHRARLRQLLGYDPLAAARNREASVRDKYKPPAHPRIPLSAARAITAAPAATPSGASSWCTPVTGRSGFGLAPAAAPPPVGSVAGGAFGPQPASAPGFGGTACGGSLFGSAPALGTASTPGAPPATALGAFAPSPFGGGFGSSATPTLGFGTPAMAANNGSGSLNRTAKKKTSSSARR